MPMHVTPHPNPLPSSEEGRGSKRASRSTDALMHAKYPLISAN